MTPTIVFAPSRRFCLKSWFVVRCHQDSSGKELCVFCGWKLKSENSFAKQNWSWISSRRWFTTSQCFKADNQIDFDRRIHEIAWSFFDRLRSTISVVSEIQIKDSAASVRYIFIFEFWIQNPIFQKRQKTDSPPKSFKMPKMAPAFDFSSMQGKMSRECLFSMTNFDFFEWTQQSGNLKPFTKIETLTLNPKRHAFHQIRFQEKYSAALNFVNPIPILTLSLLRVYR